MCALTVDWGEGFLLGGWGLEIVGGGEGRREGRGGREGRGRERGADKGREGEGAGGMGEEEGRERRVVLSST